MRSGAPWACRTTSSRRPGRPWWTASGTNSGGRGVPIQGGRESSARKRRGVLVLSLILLVWNLIASAERVVSAMFFPSVDRVVGSPDIPSAPDNEAVLLSVQSP